jgi:hypothetical protein
MIKVKVLYPDGWKKTYCEYHGDDWGTKKKEMQRRANDIKLLFSKLDRHSATQRPQEIDVQVRLLVGGPAVDGDVIAEVFRGGKTRIATLTVMASKDRRSPDSLLFQGQDQVNQWFSRDKMTDERWQEWLAKKLSS